MNRYAKIKIFKKRGIIMSFKVAFIGAGSIGFTRGLLADILTVPEFHDIEVAFTDINPDNLRMVTQLCQRDIEENGLNIKIQATLDRREAFKDAKYVINCVRIGMLEAFATDVEIPLKYGVDQCVGDTLCIGGIMYGQRGINAMLDFCKDIREVAAPGCILLNYSNPNAMITWACNKYGGVKTYGLCHGVQHGHEQIAKALGRDKKDVDIICAGLNHQTWYISVKTDGKERTGELYELMKQSDFAKDENIRLDVMKNFGFYSTESNGHLSEYLMWYRKRPENMEKWINYSCWIQGETAGYLRVCKESRNWFTLMMLTQVNIRRKRRLRSLSLRRSTRQPAENPRLTRHSRSARRPRPSSFRRVIRHIPPSGNIL